MAWIYFGSALAPVLRSADKWIIETRAFIILPMKYLYHSCEPKGSLLPGRNMMFCGLSALLYGLASPNTSYHILVWVSLVPFLETLKESSVRQGFINGWLCGIMIHLVNFYWLAGTVHRFSNLNLFASLTVWLLFACYSGIAMAAMSSIFLYLHKDPPLSGLLLFPLSYTAMEHLFPFIFPWYLGAFLYEVPSLIQISDIFGISGVTFLIVAVNYALWETLQFFQKKRAIPFAALSLSLIMLVSTLAYGFWRIPRIEEIERYAPSITVGVVQPNMAIEDMDSPLKQKSIWRRYRQLSQSAVKKGAQLIVWPESAIGFAFLPEGIENSASGLLKNMIQAINRPVLFGSWAHEADGIRNRAYFLDSKGRVIGRYDKVKLLPFGEFLPWADEFPILKKWIQGPGDFHAGPGIHPICYKEACFGVLICFEATVNTISREHVNKGATFLVNITNDAWFGRTRCAEQHLMLAVFRAIENRVWLVRAANTGMSAFVDPAGRIQYKSPLFEPSNQALPVKLLEIPSIYKQWGNWFPVSCAIIVALCALPLMLKKSM